MSGLFFISILRYFFWLYMLFPYLPLQTLLSNAFYQETINMIYNFGSWPQKCLRLSKTFWTNYAPLFQASCLVFRRNMLKDLLNCADEMLLVLIFDICNSYEIVTYEWLYLHYWGSVKIIYMASKIGVSFSCVS